MENSKISIFVPIDAQWSNYFKKSLTKNYIIFPDHAAITQIVINCFGKEREKVVAKFVFLLLLKVKNLFRQWRKNKFKNDFCQWQKSVIAKSARKEWPSLVIMVQKCVDFLTFCVCCWKRFWRTSSKELLFLAKIFSATGGKRLTTKWEKDNNKFFFEFCRRRERNIRF